MAWVHKDPNWYRAALYVEKKENKHEMYLLRGALDNVRMQWIQIVF